MRISKIMIGPIALLATMGRAAELPDPTPSCVHPVSIEGKPNDLGYIVMFVREISDPAILAAELGQRYDFSSDAVFTAVKGFAVAALTPQVLAGLRCESTVRRIFYNQPLRIEQKSTKERLINSSPRRKPGSILLKDMDSGFRRNDDCGINQSFPK